MLFIQDSFLLDSLILQFPYRRMSTCVQYGSLNLIPTFSLPRTIAEFYRYETKDFGPVRSHRLWASGQNGFTIGLGDLKRKGSLSNHQRVHGRMPIAK